MLADKIGVEFRPQRVSQYSFIDLMERICQHSLNAEWGTNCLSIWVISR